MEAPVAAFKIFGSRPGGDLFEITVEVGMPVRVADTAEEWVCLYDVRPLEGGRFRVHGGSSFQALTLALRSTLRFLEDFRESGGQLFYEPGVLFEFGPHLVTLRHPNGDA